MTGQLVSVIVPNYNHGRFLEERLETIYNQTYKNTEVILLDDASDDNSVSILKRYANRYSDRTVLCINDINSGSPFKQWKKGIDLAKGTYVWIAESDDSSRDNFIEKMVALFSDPSVTMAFCKSKYYSDSSQEHENALPVQNDVRWQHDFAREGVSEYIEHFAYRQYMLNVSSAMFRYDCLAQADLDTNYKYMGDWLIFAQLLTKGKLAYLAEELNLFRFHENTTRNTRQLNYSYTDEVCQAVQWHIDNVKSYGEEPHYEKYKWFICHLEKNLFYKDIFHYYHFLTSFPMRIKLDFLFNCFSNLLRQKFFRSK